jgi:hypothetical protein
MNYYRSGDKAQIISAINLLHKGAAETINLLRSATSSRALKPMLWLKGLS